MIDPKIKTVVTLSKIKSFTQTARLLSLTQPAVSQHLKNVEEEYDIKIFYRENRLLNLTPEGEIFIKYGEQLIQLYNKLKIALKDLKKNHTHFSIGITSTAADFLIPSILANFYSNKEDYSVNFHNDTLKNIYTRLESYEFDYAIVDGLISHPKFQSILLEDDYLCAFVSPLNPLVRQTDLTFKDLKKEKFILRHTKATTRMLLENYLVSHNDSIQNYDITLEIENVPIIKELVANNLGISILSHSVVQDEIKRGKLIELKLKDFYIKRGFYILFPKNGEFFEHIQQLTKYYEENKKSV